MKKILYIMLVCFSFNANAEDKSSSKSIDYYKGKLDNCQHLLEKEINKECPKVGWNEGECAYTKYTKIKIKLHEKQLECYNDVANGIFKNFYKDNYDKRVKSYDEYVKTSTRAFVDLYTDVDFCSKQNCGLQEYSKAYDDLSSYIFQYINLHIENIKNKQKESSY